MENFSPKNLQEHIIRSHHQTIAYTLYHRPSHHAVIVMTHGFGLHMQGLTPYIEAYFAAGFDVVILKQLTHTSINPWQQISALTTVLTQLKKTGYVSIGLWGFSYGAAHNLVTCTHHIDIRCGVGIAPFISGQINRNYLAKKHDLPQIKCHRRKIKHYSTTQIKLIGPAEENPIIISKAGKQLYDLDEHFRNKTPYYSLIQAIYYAPITYFKQGLKIPHLILIAEDDHINHSEAQISNITSSMQGTKSQLTLMSGGHFGCFRKQQEAYIAQSVAWYLRYLT